MTTNRSDFIRNIVVMLDFVVVNGVVWANHSNRGAEADGVGALPALLLCASVAMGLSQLFFSTIVHRHYRSIDMVLRQVASLSCLFAAAFVSLAECLRGAFPAGGPPSVAELLRMGGWCAGALVAVRLAEYVAVRRLRLFGRNSRSVVFVGEAVEVARAFEQCMLMPVAGVSVRGCYCDGALPEGCAGGMERIGSLSDLRAALAGGSRLCDDIYCTEMPDRALISALVDYSMRNGIQFNYVPAGLNSFGYCLRPRVDGELVVFSNMDEPLLKLGNRFIKRSFDIAVSGTAILLLLPFIPVIGAAIKLSSPGPVFFRQRRTGLNGQDFGMLKFRSMHVNADSDTRQATRDDPRKFAFGDFMRRTSIDELPQLFNVFAGDMSIVGPRPHMVAHTDQYRREIYEYMLRHMVRPGITGWAQTTGYRGETPELWQMEGRVQRDIWYIQNWSFWLDVRIIIRTALQVIGRRDPNAF